MSKVYAHELRAMKDERYEKERRQRATIEIEHCRLRVIQLATTGSLVARFTCAYDIINDVEIGLRVRFPDTKFSILQNVIIVDWA